MAVKRKLSTKGKIITGLIYALAIALVVTVILQNRLLSVNETETTTPATQTTNAETADLPYNSAGSDKYAGIEPAYKSSEVELRTEGSEKVAYVNNQKALNYTGVCSDGKDWYFVRNGVVDTYYNGIAGNELGDWYVKAGKVDFTYTNSYSVNGTTYKVEQGKAVANS